MKVQTFFTHCDFSDQHNSFNVLEQLDDKLQVDCLLLYCQGLKPEKMSEFGSALAASKLSVGLKDDALYSVINNKFHRSPIEAAKLVQLINDNSFKRELTAKILDYVSMNEEKSLKGIESILN
ncbi:MAG: hypothetical protein EOP04_21455 [Proteobacteria bacterium]|nr:MAG: hypothetical protein EOP04_21455 [Pseudomonadota bacterium]